MNPRNAVQDPIHTLYQEHAYPPMSHPLSDPAVTAAAACLAGFEPADPATARILEIGCCSGHNLIPLAMRWPESHCTGIDLAESSVAEATRRARQAGASNIRFLAEDLCRFEPDDGPYDFIIAHGFLSWVPPGVQAALFGFCRNHLSPNGIATVSFNLENGWRQRFPVILKARAILAAGATSIVHALEVLRTVTEVGSAEFAIIDEMLAKGEGILGFDDFGPVNDPWPLERFVSTAEEQRLRWLGESDPAARDGEELSVDGLHRRRAEDEATLRTFRSEILCRDDAPQVEPSCKELCLRAGPRPARTEDDEIWSRVAASSPACVPAATALKEVEEERISAGIQRGWLLPRADSLSYDPVPPEFPKLNAFRLLCAAEHLPLVDAWHMPCGFPSAHYQVLAAMDGTRGLVDLRQLAATRCPELAFEPWLAHLAGRGMFSR